MPLLTTITGTLYKITGELAPNTELIVTPVQAVGIDVVTDPITPNPISDENAIITFQVIRGSIIKIEGSVRGYNQVGGKIVRVPNEASVTLSSLTSLINFPTQGIILQEEGVDLPGLYGRINFVGSTVNISEVSAGTARVDVSATSLVWGNITGTLANQTDLQSALDLKSPLSNPTFTGTVSAGLFLLPNNVAYRGSSAISGTIDLIKANTLDHIHIAPGGQDTTIGGGLDVSGDLRLLGNKLVDSYISSAATWNAKQDALGFTAVPNTRTINGHALSADFNITPTDLSLVIGVNTQAYSSVLDTWATKTPYVGDLTITTGKTVNITKSLTFGGTDGTTMTFPSTSATIARTDAANSFTGTQNITGNVVVGNANALIFGVRSIITSGGADGLIQLTNQATTGFTGLILGTNDTNGIRIKKNSTAFNFRLGDDSADASITTGAVSHSGALSFTSTAAANNLITQGAALNIGSTSTDGIVLQNTTAAAAGAQQWSPRLRFTAQGWKTASTASSQTVDWVIENQPTQGASSPSSNLIFSYQINGGGYSSLFAVLSGNGISTSYISPTVAAAGTTGISLATNNISIAFSSAALFSVSNAGVVGLGADGLLAWSNTNSNSNQTKDLILRRNAPANLALGAADAASPVAQTLSVQNVIAGTNNTAGANWTRKASAGTGTGIGGNHIWQVAPAGSTGTAQNTFVDALTIDSTKLATFTGDVKLSGANATIYSRNFEILNSSGVAQTYFTSDGVNGNFNIYTAAGNDFGRINLGGTTSSFPAIKRSGATLAFRVADDSANTSFSALSATLSGTISTADPTSGQGPVWKLGAKKTGSLTLDTGNYIEISVDGVIYKAALVT